MSKLLLLYDTGERDLARDVADLLTELQIEVVMIPRAPDSGKTLQDKESQNFNDVDGALFLITPGAVREGVPMPSPSVADEMGQAKVKFEKKPSRVIYLVDDRCKIQAVDQRAYISFRHDDLRSVIDAITRVIRDLRQAGLIGPEPPEARAAPGVDIAAVASKTDDRLKYICEFLSHSPLGGMEFQQFREVLRKQVGMNEQDINFAIRDLQTQGLVIYKQSSGPVAMGFFMLTPVGWELVRFEKRLKGNVLDWLGSILANRPKTGGPFGSQGP